MNFFKRIGGEIKTGYQKTKEAYRKTAPIRRGVASAAKKGYRGSVVAAKGLARDVRDIRMAGSIRTPRKRMLKTNKKVKSPYVAGYREIPRKVGGKWKVERTPIIKYKRKNHLRKIKKIKRSSYRNDDPFGVWGNFRY